MPPRLHITAESDEFDPEFIQHWKEEGFDVSYLPFTTGKEREFIEELKHLPDDLELGEAYALIAFGDAAALALDVHQKPQPHLAALVAYYPTTIRKPNASYPSQLRLLVHLAGSQPFAPVFPSYRYEDTEPGFAESDLEEFSKAAARLAWSRSLNIVRKGFKIDVELERLWDEHVARKFVDNKFRDAAATMETMVAEPYVNHIPTLTGGIGRHDLFRFYRDFFIPGNPPSMKIKLVSRTIGTDRVADEMIVSFRHTQEVPWMLPGVPPTDKTVQVALVSVVCIRGGKLYHEHIYWDQATVLVQLGLLDPKLVPESMKSKGMKQLPVAGVEAARKVLDEDSVPSNKLLPKW
ncbi:hypothetical protein BDY21DRAFT_285916 [Lineolata rhizophorae]|uniref:SnoaL-like domain-containing protein n=1 Tax=Lineolata rhizophorae TaxID=578093 RepID=A0A6A6P0Q8_9PEZI|nr:hypothetical protein BDY21DRAFT_285916 [Lineolata rhizophorae]